LQHEKDEMNFIEYLRKIFTSKNEPGENGNQVPVNLIPKVMTSLEHTEIEEYTCDQVYELLDQFTELVHRQEDAARLMPLVQHHLDMCGDCREEFEALLRILQSQNS
jgi:uncharacterized circularly permuted ATP-grasp superfamily protein